MQHETHGEKAKRLLGLNWLWFKQTPLFCLLARLLWDVLLLAACDACLAAAARSTSHLIFFLCFWKSSVKEACIASSARSAHKRAFSPLTLHL